MGRSRTDRSDLLTFGIALVIFAGSALFVGLQHGEDIGLWLQDTPTTRSGWLFFGWLVSGPPFALTVLLWLERRRFTRGARRIWSLVLPLWLGLNLFILPARFGDVYEQFGSAALVGIPLSFGWVWGIFATGLIAALAGISVLVMSFALKPERARALLASRVPRTVLERVWLLALVVALGIALYGGNAESGIFNDGM